MVPLHINRSPKTGGNSSWHDGACLLGGFGRKVASWGSIWGSTIAWTVKKTSKDPVSTKASPGLCNSSQMCLLLFLYPMMDRPIWEDCQTCQALVTEFEKVLVRCGGLQFNPRAQKTKARSPERLKTSRVTDSDISPKQRKKQKTWSWEGDGSYVREG